MENKDNKPTLDEVRNMDIVDYLANLGIQPTKIRNADFWYHSPLRSERTPSFKVNRNLNRWYDFGTGTGGNLIDFAISYHGCTIGEFLATLSGERLRAARPSQPPSPKVENSNKLLITDERPLRSGLLMRYLQDRRICISIADEYCKEVQYNVAGNTYTGIGFKNDSGGFEIRSPYFKGSSSPKDISMIGNDGAKVAVFEGFMDFLSFRTLYPDHKKMNMDFLVLNSVSFFQRARPKMEVYGEISLFLDRDTAGRDCTLYAQSLGERYSDRSQMYQNYKDLNDWVCQIGKKQDSNHSRRMYR